MRVWITPNAVRRGEPSRRAPGKGGVVGALPRSEDSAQTAQPIRALVVDDERLGRERLAMLLANVPDVRLLGQCANGRDAVEMIANAEERDRPDVVFLDVQMPDLDGLGVVEALMGILPAENLPDIVFVTAHSEYMERAFELHAIDYLRKPYTDARFAATLAHVRRRVDVRRSAADAVSASPVRDESGEAALRRLLDTLHDHRQHDRIAVRDRATGTVRFVHVDQVVWVEAEGPGQVRLHMPSGTLVWHRGIESVESDLAPLGFLRVHRSRLVNPSHLVSAKALTKGQYMLTMTDGMQFDTGRAYASNIEAHLANTPGGR